MKETFLGGGPQPGTPGYVAGFLGGVAADEPRAALAGREVLSAGGTAGDAAVAMALTLTVTLPSRAGLGGGGACIAYSPGKNGPAKGLPEAVMFTPIAPQSVGPNADRPAAVPTMVRGLFLLHARYGSQPFESLVSSVEQIARFGVPVSRALVNDLKLVAGPLLADPGARAVFSQDGVPLSEGQILRQPDLGGTLAQIRVAGVGDFYQGALARRIQQASVQIGGPLSAADLRGALPKLMPPLVRDYRNDKVAFLPPPADGGSGCWWTIRPTSTAPMRAPWRPRRHGGRVARPRRRFCRQRICRPRVQPCTRLRPVSWRWTGPAVPSPVP